MTTDEHIRGVLPQFVHHQAVVTRRTSTDMCDPHTNTTASEALVLRIGTSQSRIVDVAVHGTQGFPRGQFFRNRIRTDVTGVPDLIALVEVLAYPRIQPAMGIG